MAEDITPPESPFIVWFRLLGLIIGLIMIGLGVWQFIWRLIEKPEHGGSNLVPLVIIFVGVFIAISTRISKRRASRLANRPD